MAPILGPSVRIGNPVELRPAESHLALHWRAEEAVPEGRDLESLRAHLVERLPEWLAAGPVRVGSIARASGLDEALAFEAAWQVEAIEHRRALELRVVPESPFTVPPPCQARVMGTLREAGLPVPRVVAVEPRADRLGAPYLVTEREDEPGARRSLGDLSESARGAAWWAGVDALCALPNAMDPLRLSAFAELNQPERGPDPLRQSLHACREGIEAHLPDRGRHALLETALVWLEARVSYPQPVWLSWGDARFAAMTIRDGACCAMYGWSGTRIAHPVADLASYCMSERVAAEAEQRPAWAGVPSEAESLARWRERTALDAAHWDDYRVLTLLRQALHEAAGGADPENAHARALRSLLEEVA